MALNALGMSAEVRAAIDILTNTQKADHKLVWDEICKSICNHIVTNLEIRGVETDVVNDGITASSLAQIFISAPVTPNDGGAVLKAAVAAAIPSGPASTGDGVQSNDGTGLVE